MQNSSGKSLIWYSSIHVSSRIFLILWWKGENWEGKWGCWMGNMSTDDGDDISNIENCRNTYYGGVFIPTSTRQKWINHITSEAILETSKVCISNSGLADKKHIVIYYVAYIRGMSFHFAFRQRLSHDHVITNKFFDGHEHAKCLNLACRNYSIQFIVLIWQAILYSKQARSFTFALPFQINLGISGSLNLIGQFGGQPATFLWKTWRTTRYKLTEFGSIFLEVRTKILNIPLYMCLLNY